MSRRKLLVLLAAGLISAALAAGFAAAAKDKGNDKNFQYTIGLWGDLPYSDAQAQVGVPNLIADMNDSDIEFSVHDGDLKAGSATPGSVTPTTCATATPPALDIYTQGLGYFNSFAKPAMFTPGDNDWTDCDRVSNGSFDATERLQHERDVLFSGPYAAKSFGKKQLGQEVQTAPLCVGWDYGSNSEVSGVPCVENRRWLFHEVVYATVDIQGTCNDLCKSGSATDPSVGDANGDPAEYQAREAADEQWLQQTFDEANATNAAAVMIIGQADPGFDKADGTRAPVRDPKTLAETDGNADGYQAFLLKLRQLTIAFGKPVVYVHGDSHYFRVDKPLQDANGMRIENFSRVETFGDNAPSTNDVQWVKALVDPESRDVFAFQPQIVPGNVGTYTP
jgi:hypothetical protein